MAWDFETDPEFQEKLDWIDGFVPNLKHAARERFGDPAEILRDIADEIAAR